MIKSKYNASITDKRNEWWNLAPNCIAAYQPKGAKNYEASKTNLANPGTYNAVDGVAPDFDVVSGWMFNGTDTTGHYLTIPYKIPGVGGGKTHSIILRLSNFAGDGARVVDAGGTNMWHIHPRYTNNTAYIRGYNSTGITTAFTGTSGVFALVPGNGYVNGTALGGYATNENGFVEPRLASGVGTEEAKRWAGYIQAVALYSVDISSYVSSLTTAMNAL